MKTSTQINNYIAEIAKLAGLSNNKSQAIQLGHERYLTYENTPVYGGCRLIMINVKNGGHSGAFGGNGCEARLKPAVFIEKLNGIIAGLETVKIVPNTKENNLEREIYLSMLKS